MKLNKLSKGDLTIKKIIFTDRRGKEKKRCNTNLICGFCKAQLQASPKWYPRERIDCDKCFVLY